MIGDTSAGGCGSLSFQGVVGITFEHPTFNCNRLNIAENNSPTPRDRVYFQYNHFHNITELDILGGFLWDNRGTNDLSIDRFTFGLEKSFFHE